MILWRIGNHADLQGVGGPRASGRWHHRGVPVVYLAENAALAMLETLIHFELAPGEAPVNFRLLEVECPDDLRVMSWTASQLAGSWREDPSAIRRLGTEWIESRSSALLKVPSAIAPKSHNFVLNPRHDDASSVTIKSSHWHPLDARLLP